MIRQTQLGLCLLLGTVCLSCSTGRDGAIASGASDTVGTTTDIVQSSTQDIVSTDV